jgi:CDGSH-type Zn-finger protein
MDKPKVAGVIPETILLEPGETYAWCSCGLSNDQPFCNGAHKGTSFTPFVFTSEFKQHANFCTCKLTSNPPYCDGAHLNIGK